MLRHNRKGQHQKVASSKLPEQKNFSKDDSSRPTKFKAWLLASRPKTLTASVVPVLVSTSLITHYSSFHSDLHLQSSNTSIYSHQSLGFCFAVFACLIQLGTNLYNDYSDFIKGADNDNRVGQARATQKGWLTPNETAFGSVFCLGIATILGLYLTFLSSSWSSTNGIQIDKYMAFVTISSVFNAFCYTGGEYPLGYIGLGHLSIGYSGLGDLFVFLYFGLVATITVPYLFLIQCQMESIWGSELMFMSFCVALPMGFLATAIITVNNLRDRETDVVAGKNTMAVRFGEWFTRIEYIVLVLTSYIMLVPLCRILMISNDSQSGKNNVWVLLPFLSFPVAWKELKAVGFGGKDGAALNEHVGGIAKVQLIFSLLLIVSLNLIKI